MAKNSLRKEMLLWSGSRWEILGKQKIKLKQIKFILNIFFIISFYNGFGQDIHFSQYFSTPLNMNPANAGFFEGTQRFCLNNKNQWSSISVPFQTISASYDMKLNNTKKFHPNLFGIGVIINSDKAGDSEFGTTEEGLALSFIKALDNKGRQFLSFGFMPAIAQRSINLKKLTFDDQFDDATLTYNPDKSSDETFSSTNFSYFDCAAGVNWGYYDIQGNLYNAGFSISHLNQPRQSFFGDNNVRLDIKNVLYFNCKIVHSLNKFESYPCVTFVSQGQYKEFMIGTKSRYIFKYSSDEFYALDLGLYTRVGDAAIVLLGLDYNKLSLGISYDINYSKLYTASLYRGGLELSLQYILNNAKLRKPARIPCPIF